MKPILTYHNGDKLFELQPHKGRKSFYGKAQVIQQEINGEIISKLQSYSTIVAEYNHTTNTMTVRGWYSNTTARHINAFLNYYGFNTCNKKQLQNYKQ